MRKICVLLLLTIFVLGCGYTKPSNSMGGGAAPAITSLMPSSALHGGSAFNLMVNGTNFTPSSTVNWNGTPRTTTYNSTMGLTAAISAADIASPGMASVTVVTTGGVYGGGVTSSPMTFTIN